MLNCIVAGLLFRPLESTPKKSTKEESKELTSDVGGFELKANPQVSALKNGDATISSSMHALPTADIKKTDDRMHKSDLHLHLTEGIKFACRIHCVKFK